MSNWLSNGPCPKCGSRDNLATYDDGHQWCWGCGHYVAANGLEVVRKKLLEPASAPVVQTVALPYDVEAIYPPEALKWVSKYGLVRSDLVTNRVLWSESSGLLIFPLTDGEGRIVAWQGRNFGEKYSVKWFGRGSLESTFVFFPRSTARAKRIIFVEDIVSAIKVGKVIQGLSDLNGTVCQPVFGSHISRARLSRCLHIMDERHITFWLDNDKFKESIKFRQQANSLGFKATVINTALDPKEISLEEIETLLRG